MERQITVGKGAEGGRLVSAVFHAAQFISGRLGFSQYLQMASLGQRDNFELLNFLWKNDLECTCQSP